MKIKVKKYGDTPNSQMFHKIHKLQEEEFTKDDFVIQDEVEGEKMPKLLNDQY